MNPRLKALLFSLALCLLNTFALAQSATLPVTEGFEGEYPLPSYWQAGGTNAGGALVTTEFGPHSGESHLLLYNAGDEAEYAQASLTLTADLVGKMNVWLSFWAKELENTPHAPPPYAFPGMTPFDGVAVSNDGGKMWHEIQSLRQLDSSWREIKLDLDVLTALLSLDYTSTFRIRFNQYGNDTSLENGIAIDDISLTAEPITALNEVWVDTNYDGPERGRERLPYNTLEEATRAVEEGGKIIVKGESLTLSEKQVLSKPLSIQVATP